MHLPVKLLHPQAQEPQRQREGDYGYDLRACEEAVIAPGERAAVPCGFALALPDGVAGLILPRSGLASKQGLTVINSPGLIDHGYRGEVKVALINHSREEQVIEVGNRIAQLLLVPALIPEIVVLDKDEQLPEAADGRGAQGFGSSGIS